MAYLNSYRVETETELQDVWYQRMHCRTDKPLCFSVHQAELDEVNSTSYHEDEYNCKEWMGDG